MKRRILILLTSMLGASLSAMDRPLPAKTAAPAQEQTQDLIIQNNYPGAIDVEYVMNDNPDPITTVVQPGTEERIPNIRSMVDLKFLTHGDYLKFLNFRSSPNYRAWINDLLATDTKKDIRITIDPTRLMTEEPTVARPAPQEEWKGWTAKGWELAGSAYQKAKEAVGYIAHETVKHVGPFDVKKEAVPRSETKPKTEAFEGKPLYEAFSRAKSQILSKQRVYGRHILNIRSTFSVNDAEAAKNRLTDKWKAQRALYEKIDPRSVAYVDAVLELINEAYRDPNKEFSAERLSKIG